MLSIRKITALLVGSALMLGCTNVAEDTYSARIIEISSSDIPLVIGASVEAKSGGVAIGYNGETVKVQDPSRVVALSPGSAEVIVRLGLKTVLVGRDLTDNQAELQDIEIVTDTHTANLEKILAVKPTLVIVDDNSRPISVIEDLQNLGIQVVKIPVANDFEKAESRLRALAEIFGISELPNSLLADFQPKPYPNSQVKVAFLYLRGQSAIYLLGGEGSGADAMIAAAGGIDVGAQAGLGSFTPLTPEYLVELNPDVLLVMEAGLTSVGGAEGLFALSGVAQTNAAKKQQLIVVEDSLLLSYGARSSQLVTALHQAFSQMMPDD